MGSSARRSRWGVLALLVWFAGAEAAVLEEIVVVAQKREESLQDVGIAVSAFTGNQIEQLGWTSAEQVTAMSPGVTTIQPNGPSAFFTNIRGVAQNDFSGDHQESPVAIYLDDVYISAASGAGFQLFDFERIEVLRGPQGTLFGRNATGGLVHYITRKPSQQADGYIQGTYGDYDQMKVEGAIGGGITEILSGRLSFVRNTHDPIFKNRIGPDLNDGDDWAVRGQLLFEFNDRAEWLLSLRAGNQDVKVAPWSHGSARLNPVTGLGEDFDGPDLTAVGDSRNEEGYQDPDGDLLKGSINIEGFNKTDTTGFTSNLSFGLGDTMELVFITDYSELEKDYIEDSDAGPGDFFSFSLRSDIEQFSQEIRLIGSTERTDWVVGAYYLDIDGSFMNGGPASNFFAAAFPGFGLDDPSLETLGLFNPFETKTKSYALFAQMEFQLTNQFRATAGLRWSVEDKEMNFQQFFSLFETTNSFDVAELDGLGLGGAIWTYSPDEVSNLPGGPAFGFDPIVGDPGSASLKDDLITAKLALEWTPSDDLLGYVSYNRGIKAGGYNAPIDATDFYAGARSPEEMRFDEEVLNAYEVGAKWTFADGRARLNAAAYYYDYNDYQAFDLDSLTTIVFNTDAETYGVELELQATPTDGLDLMLGGSWLHNNVEDAFTRPDGTDIDRKAVLTPEWNLNGMVRYQWSALKGIMSVQGDATYMSKHYFQLKNSPVGTEDAYAIVNARVTWGTEDGDWLLSVFMDNVFDEGHRLMVFDLAGDPTQGGFGMYESYAGQPRWWGASVRYAWGL